MSKDFSALTTELDKQQDLFVDEFSEIDKEIEAINDLYSEVKEHYDEIKNSAFKGSLTFIEKQTTNLVSLKTAKLNLLKEKMNAKKTLIDLSLKERSIQQKETLNNDSDDAIESMAKLLKELKYERENNTALIDNDEYDEELDALLKDEEVDINNPINSLSNEDDETENNIEEVEQEEKPKTTLDSFIAVDSKTGLFYKLNNDYEILEELGKIDKISEYTEYDGEQYGLGKSGEMYIVIEIEE